MIYLSVSAHFLPNHFIISRWSVAERIQNSKIISSRLWVWTAHWMVHLWFDTAFWEIEFPNKTVFYSYSINISALLASFHFFITQLMTFCSIWYKISSECYRHFNMKFGASNWYHYKKHRDVPIHNVFFTKICRPLHFRNE